MSQDKEYWGSRIGVIFAVMGSAIGLGNFLRFPGLAAKYEGGVFMIPYFISLLLLGLPIAWSEWAMGRYGGSKGFSSSPGIFSVIWKNRASPYTGVLGLIVPVGIYIYYVFIESWCLYYAVSFATGAMNLGKDPDAYVQFFNNYIGTSENGILFSGDSPALYYLAIAFVINFVIIFRGINKGIEVVSRYAIPLLFISAFVVLARVLTLGTPDPSLPDRNVLNGLGFMWNPGSFDGASILHSLANAQMWLEAAGQIFFSLSVGFGIIITYASYLKKDDDVLLSGTSSASGNIFAEVALGGLITIPAAFIFLGSGGIREGTFDLGFLTLPIVFEYMPLGNLFGFLWFFLLFIAAVTSSISMLQPAIAFFEEGLGTGRKASVALLGLITLLGALFLAQYSQGLKALATFDFWIGTFAIFILAMVEVIIFSWVFGADRVMDEVHRGALIRLPRFVKYIIQYIAPVYLITVFVFWAFQQIPAQIQNIQDDPVTRYTLGFIGILLVFFLILITTAVNRWKKMESVSGVREPGSSSGEGK